MSIVETWREARESEDSAGDAVYLFSREGEYLGQGRERWGVGIQVCPSTWGLGPTWERDRGERRWVVTFAVGPFHAYLTWCAR